MKCAWLENMISVETDGWTRPCCGEPSQTARIAPVSKGILNHADTTPRVHIPLITNPQSWFIFKNGMTINLDVGKVYWLDTRREHTAINGSDDWRLHLVGVVED